MKHVIAWLRAPISTWCLLKVWHIQVPPIRSHGDREKDKKSGPAENQERARDKNTVGSPIVSGFHQYIQVTIHPQLLFYRDVLYAVRSDCNWEMIKIGIQLSIMQTEKL